MKAGDEVICNGNYPWEFPGPKKDDIVKIDGLLIQGGTTFYYLVGYHVMWNGIRVAYLSTCFSPVLPQSAIDELMKEVEELQTIAI